MKYFYIYGFLTCIIIVFIFVRGTTIREGAKVRKKKKKNNNANDDDEATPSTTSTVVKPSTTTLSVVKPSTTTPSITATPSITTPSITSNSVVTPSTTTPSTTTPSTVTADSTSTPSITSAATGTQNVKSILEQITPNIVASLIKPQVDSITQAQTAIAQAQSNITQTQSDIQNTQSSLQKNAKTLSNQQQKLKSDMNNMTNYYKDLSLNMFNQYTMYKTSLANESNLGLSSVKTAVKNAQTSATDANASASKALDAAAKTESIHRDVFGKTSAKVVQNDLAGFEGFSSTESIYNQSNTNNPVIYELEHDVIDKLNDFNTKYAEYMKCKADSKFCTGTQVTQDDLKAKANEIQTAIKALQDAYTTSSSDISSLTFDQNHQAIMTKANEIMSKRAELDAKVANIMQPNSELNRFYDSTIYSKIVLSVLASSLAYYVIME
jgi:hypothetical protein